MLAPGVREIVSQLVWLTLPEMTQIVGAEEPCTQRCEFPYPCLEGHCSRNFANISGGPWQPQGKHKKDGVESVE